MMSTSMKIPLVDLVAQHRELEDELAVASPRDAGASEI